MIVGVGIDVVDIARFEESLTRTPGLRERLFTAERARRSASASLAARFAAKEALAKALGAPGGLHWHDAEVVRRSPAARASCSAAPSPRAPTSSACAACTCRSVHDAGIASAVVVVEG